MLLLSNMKPQLSRYLSIFNFKYEYAYEQSRKGGANNQEGYVPSYTNPTTTLGFNKKYFSRMEDENIMQPICSIHKTHNIFFFPNERSEGIVF